VTCRGCGGAIPLKSLTPEVRCPYCGNVQAVDKTLLAELARYQESLKSRLDEAHRDLDIARSYDVHYGRLKKSGWKVTVVAVLLFMVLPVVVIYTGIYLMKRGVLSNQDSPLITMAVMGTVAAALVLYFVWYYWGRRKKRTLSIGPTKVSCPTCGAQNELQPGQVIETCMFCGGALVPSARAMAETLDAARQAARSARMERFRKEREGMATIMSYSAGSTVPYIVMGSFAFMLVPATAIFSYQMAVGKEPFHPAIFILWALSMGLVAVMAGLVAWRRRRRRQWKSALDSLALKYGGRSFRGAQDLVQWLNTFWPGPYNIVNIMAGTYGGGAVFTLRGFPALLFVDPVPVSDKHRAKVHLFISAFVPGVSDAEDDAGRSGPAPETFAAWFNREGFAVTVQEAGLMAEADDDIVRRLRRAPGEAVGLEPVFLKMVETAKALGAGPAGPL
jgi:cytochrome c-type biogenesis protein CcmH/NrfF